mmetsp:Transcript_30791/g.60234  ORF Transcript_30791/g.60234 Transcript_30791/m.60234 type:complete len:93 (+) Transcript_30791:163-441(+)
MKKKNLENKKNYSFKVNKKSLKITLIYFFKMETGALDWIFVLISGLILTGAVGLQKSLGDVIGDEANLDPSIKNKSDNSIKKRKNFLKKRKN